MKLRRILVGFITLLLPFASLRAQEAVEERATEPASVEPPSLTEQSTESRPKHSEREQPKEERATSALQDSMTAQEFKAAGLEKLSADELKNLNDWLQGYRKKAETKATEVATAEVTKKVKAQTRAKLEQVDSRVDGTIERLTGHSIIKLEDGTTWKQANPDDHYPAQVSDHPSARVSRGAFGWKMRIAGLPEFYVDPVR
jgi:hypothetical protein